RGARVPREGRAGAGRPWLWLFPSTEGALGVWRGALYPARLQPRPADKLGYLARVLLMPTLGERRMIRLPDRLAVLYYPLRPLRLASRCGLDLLRAGLRALRDGSATASPD